MSCISMALRINDMQFSVTRAQQNNRIHRAKIIPSFLILSCLVLPCRVFSCPLFPCLVLSVIVLCCLVLGLVRICFVAVACAMLSCLALTCPAFPWLDLKLLLLVSYLLNADSPWHRLQPISICFFSTTWPWCQTVDGKNFAKKIKPCQNLLCRTMFKPVTQRACDPHTPNFNVEHGTIKDSRNYFRGNDQRSLEKKHRSQHWNWGTELPHKIAHLFS